GQTCTAERVTAFAEAWNDVRLEHDVGERRRPDIVLMRDRGPTAAIEVLVSSRVVPEKAAALARLGVPWIEVQADATLADPDGWTPAVPLAVVRTSIDGEWRCAVHAPI